MHLGISTLLDFYRAHHTDDALNLGSELTLADIVEIQA